MGASTRLLVVFLATVIYSVQCMRPDQDDIAEFEDDNTQAGSRLKNFAKSLVLDYLERTGEFPEDGFEKRNMAGQAREIRNDKDFSKLVNSFGRRNVAPSFSKWTFGKRSDNMNDMEKRRLNSFYFGKRSLEDALDMDEKRRMSSFSFGKRGPLNAFTFGKRLNAEQQDGADMEDDKRYSAFAFGKRGDDMDKRYSSFTFGKRDMNKRLSSFTFGKRGDASEPYNYIPDNEALLDSDDENTLPKIVLK